MQNLALAETVLSNIRRNPASFRMESWGVVLPARGLFRRKPGGYIACLAGHTLLSSGYALTRDNTFVRGRELVEYQEVAVAAKELLGLTMEEYEFRYPGHCHESCTLFCGRAQNRTALAALEILAEYEREKMVTAA